jgi:hypothetical protein
MPDERLEERWPEESRSGDGRVARAAVAGCQIGHRRRLAASKGRLGWVEPGTGGGRQFGGRLGRAGHGRRSMASGVCLSRAWAEAGDGRVGRTAEGGGGAPRRAVAAGQGTWHRAVVALTKNWGVEIEWEGHARRRRWLTAKGGGGGGLDRDWAAAV